MPTEKKHLMLRLGLPLSVLCAALLLYTLHRVRHPSTNPPAAPASSAATAPAAPGAPAAPANPSASPEIASRPAPEQEESSVAHAPVSAERETPRAPSLAGKSALATQTSCFVVAYHHKPLPSHSSDEACSHHRNLIRLKHAGINSPSLCIRVNGTPVKFQRVEGHPDQVLIGAVAGPKSVITARYCIGKVRCNEDCTIPKDEFMDAIGGSDDDSGAPAVAQWDADDTDEKETAEQTAKLTSELKRELASGDPEASGDGTYIFQDWLGEPEAAFACGARQARN